jgi:dTDP-4-dehydrorhamnose reductase
MIRLMGERESLTVVNDQTGSPTYAVDLAEMILYILQRAEEEQSWKTGLYHFSNVGAVTWFDFARAIQRLAGLTGCKLLPVSTEEYGAAAVRPAYSVLDHAKTRAAFNVVIPTWEDALERCIQAIKSHGK